MSLDLVGLSKRNKKHEQTREVLRNTTFLSRSSSDRSSSSMVEVHNIIYNIIVPAIDPLVLTVLTTIALRFKRKHTILQSTNITFISRRTTFANKQGQLGWQLMVLVTHSIAP